MCAARRICEKKDPSCRWVILDLVVWKDPNKRLVIEVKGESNPELAQLVRYHAFTKSAVVLVWGMNDACRFVSQVASDGLPNIDGIDDRGWIR